MKRIIVKSLIILLSTALCVLVVVANVNKYYQKIEGCMPYEYTNSNEMSFEEITKGKEMDYYQNGYGSYEKDKQKIKQLSQVLSGSSYTMLDRESGIEVMKKQTRDNTPLCFECVYSFDSTKSQDFKLDKFNVFYIDGTTYVAVQSYDSVKEVINYTANGMEVKALNFTNYVLKAEPFIDLQEFSKDTGGESFLSTWQRSSDEVASAFIGDTKDTIKFFFPSIAAVVADIALSCFVIMKKRNKQK